MRYVPREPDPEVNLSAEHPLAEAATLTLGLGAVFIIIAIVLIFMVDVAMYFIPVDTEADLFNAWLPEDITTVASDDERLVRVEALTQRLAGHYPESPYAFRVEIDDAPISNAMAFPGGLIIVTTGLLDQVETENELAFVVAHEIGHFRNRDHLRSLGRGLVLSLLFLTVGGGDTTTYGASIADLTLRSFNRDQETDADEFALGLIYSEYGHVADSARFFERIQDEPGEASMLVEYGSTHPTSENRIERLTELAEENGWPTLGEVVPIDWAN